MRNVLESVLIGIIVLTIMALGVFIMAFCWLINPIFSLIVIAVLAVIVVAYSYYDRIFK